MHGEDAPILNVVRMPAADALPTRYFFRQQGD
jgi:hypothetical protein